MRDAMKTLRLFVILAGFAAAVLLTHGTARAAMSCTISVSSMTFGSFDVYGAAVPSTASITGSCNHAMGSGAQTIGITIDGGAELQSNGNRAMACMGGACFATPTYSGDLLQYQLYTNASRTTVWTANTVTVNTTCTGCNGNSSTPFTAVTIYGQIPAATAGGVNDSAVGTYSDSTTVTLNY